MKYSYRIKILHSLNRNTPLLLLAQDKIIGENISLIKNIKIYLQLQMHISDNKYIDIISVVYSEEH